MINTIYIVTASIDDGGVGMIKAFTSESAALAFAQKCLDHDAAQPQHPGDTDDEAALDAWEAANNAWEKSHPAGSGEYMYYSVMSIEVEKEAGDAK